MLAPSLVLLDMHALDALHPIAAIQPARTGIDQGLRDPWLLAQLAPGSRVRATVQANLADGQFIVILKAEGGRALTDQAVHMALPAGVRPGDHLNLVFIGPEPRPRFALVADLPSQTDIFRSSEAGRFIDDLLRYPSLADRFAASRRVPLLDGPPDEPPELSLRLSQAMERSGFFYESHLAQWIAGKRTLAELLLEPQARAGGSRPGPLGALAGQEDAKVANSTLEHRIFLTEDSPHPATARHAPRQDQAYGEGLSLVRQQLEVLETRQVAWQGEAWPGQLVSLKFFEENSHASADTDPTGEIPVNPWKASLGVTLPNLGKITVDLRLHAHGLEVILSTTSLATLATLRSGTALLLQGLESGGIALLSMGVDLSEEIPSA